MKSAGSLINPLRSSKTWRAISSGSGFIRQSAAISSAPKPALAELWVDDKRVEVEPGTTILEAAAKVGVEIPRFCYHERLSVAGNCRMCLVEVEKSPKPVASCAMPVMNGMKVFTQSDKAKKAREGVMEFLLQNHPLDCPVCDQGGECDLQDQAMAFGSDKSRLQIDSDGKRAVEDKNVGPLIKTIMTRCIQCTRCVRFMNEIAGVSELGTYNRGNDLQIGTYLSNTLLKTELSGNIVDICPVGALTAKPYTFVARPWELRRFDSVDVFDAVGSNISLCQRANDLLRILPRPNDEINEEWLADKSRHAAVDGLKTQRITTPMVRHTREDNLNVESWKTALVTLGDRLSSVGSNNLEVIVGPMVDLETMVAFKDLLNSMNCDNLYVHYDSNTDPSAVPTQSDLDFRSNYLFNTTISGLEFNDIDYLLIVGSNIRYEAPLVNARIRKAWRNHQLNRICVVGPKDMDLMYDYECLGDSVDTLQKILDGKHPASKELKAAKNAAIIFGQQLKTSPKGPIGEPGSLYKLVRNLADKYKAQFSLLTGSASHNAALDIGFKPSTERKVSEKSEPGLTWLVGVDDGDLLVPKNSYIVYQGHNGDVGAEISDLVLPGFAYTEKQGTYVNMEGRVQQTLAAVSPANTLAREDWKMIRAISELINKTLPYDSLQELRERVRDLAPHLVRHSYLRSEPNTLLDPRRNQSVNLKLDTKAKLEPKLLEMAQYYQTDAISRNSETMAKCVDAVVNGIV